MNYVLILIVVDNGLVPPDDECDNELGTSLNPYCSGQWPRTFRMYYLIYLALKS